MRSSPPADRRRSPGRRGGRAFTLIELIIVMLLLAVAAGLVAPRMSSFFRGRALNFEARRMLSLTHYAQARAVGEGLPVLLWIDPRASTYGVQLLGAAPVGREPLPTFTADPTLAFVAATETPAVSELDDERLGFPEGTVVFRFNPDGYPDESSAPRIEVRQGDDAAVEIVQTADRLGYEIRPVTLRR
jgi:prepilin-type N-terminal cleavage/methylation domain-containing protein